MNFLKMFNWFRRKKKNTGLLGPDPDDPRDYQLAELQPEIAELPERFGVMGAMTPVGKQNYGSCVSWAVDGYAEYVNSKEYGEFRELSQKFIYHNTKKISDLWTVQGDYVRNAVKALVKYGACSEKRFPDKRRSSWKEYISDKPSAKAYEEAKKYKAKSYWAVKPTPEGLDQALYKNKVPIVTGMAWYENMFETDENGKLPPPEGDMVSGHAFSYVARDKRKRWFRNSWGSDYGLNGYFYIADEDIDKFNFWTSWAILDLEVPEDEITGWVAKKYIRHADEPEFREGDEVIPETGLRLRSHPTIYSSIVKRLTDQNKGVILSDEETERNGYVWRKVKITK